MDVAAAPADPHAFDATTPVWRPRLRRRLWPPVQVLLLVALSAGLWVGGLRLYSLHNDFSSFHHPDERGKGEQLVADERNFHHPMLMLETARLAMTEPRSATPPGGDPVEAAVKQGRFVSAGFAAGTAVLLAWAGFAAAGWAGFLAIGVAVGLCPALLAHAHFFKEDTALLAGIAAVLCCGAWMLRVCSGGAKLWWLIGLGVSCGLAAAGKYCGVVMVGPAVLVGVVAARRHWGLMAAVPLVVVVFAAATWLAVDYRAVPQWNEFVVNFRNEESHSQTEHFGLALPRPNAYFAGLVWAEAMPHVKVLAWLGLAVLAWQAWRRRRWAFGLWLALTAAVYLTMLAYNVIPFYRYALPATVMAYAFAGLIAASLATALPRSWMRVAATAVVVIGIAVLQGLRCRDYTAQFAGDSRDALAVWVNANVPEDATLAVDGYTELRSLDRGDGPVNTTRRVFRAMSVADLVRSGDPQDLARRGVQYVVTASSTSDRFFSTGVEGAPGDEAYFARRVAFYTALKQKPPVWSRVAAHPMWTFANPDIRVYRLDPPAGK